MTDSDSSADRHRVEPIQRAGSGDLLAGAVPDDPGIESGRAIWQRCFESLRNAMSPEEFTTWIGPLQAYLHDGTLWLGAPNRYVVDAVSTLHHERIEWLAGSCSDGVVQQVQWCIGSLADLQRRARERRPPRRHATRGRSAGSVVEQAQLEMFQMERRGQFQAVPIEPGNEFPTPLTRLPIFRPGLSNRQRHLLDEDNAVPFETPWGGGRKFGPPLTVYDEDTLMAIMRLRQNILIGSPSKMPYPVSHLYLQGESSDVHVHVVTCMLTHIQRMCGTSSGGRNDRLRLDSIRRLAGTKIEFTTHSSSGVQSGTAIDIINVKWDAYEENALLYIQFSPIMALWLERSYTYIDWNVRCQLRGDVSKALHRFLSSQHRRYTIATKKLQVTLGHLGTYKRFMRELRTGLDELKTVGWLQSHSISGNGRTEPHKMSIER